MKKAQMKAIVIWGYLATTGKDKDDAYNDLNFSDDDSECPACEIAINRMPSNLEYESKCDYCPITKWTTDKEGVFANTCTPVDTPDPQEPTTYFDLWDATIWNRDDDTTSRKEYALKVLFDIIHYWE